MSVAGVGGTKVIIMPQQQRRLGEIQLPDEHHRLYCWKGGVRNGSAVRAGETVALATKISNRGAGGTDEIHPSTNGNTERASADVGPKKMAASSADNIIINAGATMTTAASNPVHKRPSRRRRLVATTKPPPPSTSSTSDATDTVEKTDESTEKVASQNGSAASKLPAAAAAAAPASKRPACIPIVAPADGILRMGNVDDATKNPCVIGHIEECLHPTVVDGLCAICGKPPNRKDGAAWSGDTFLGPESKDAASFDNKSRVTVSGGITVTISDSEGQRMAQQDAERLRGQRKLALVLDLDHTLVHATHSPGARQYVGRSDVRHIVIPIMDESAAQQPLGFMNHYVKLRPFVKQFLKEAHRRYEIQIYTAGTRQYAEQIAMILARHVVGAAIDSQQLEDMRNQVTLLEKQLAQGEEGNTKTAKPPPSAAGMDTREENMNGVTAAVSNGFNLPADSVEIETNGSLQPRTHGEETKEGRAAEKNSDMDDMDVDDAGASNTVEKKRKAPPVAEDQPKDEEEGRPAKRKSVTFGEVPPTVKTDKLSTKDKVSRIDSERLQAELREAERMEGLAIEMRQRLFGSRITSRTDVGDLGPEVKDFKRIFPDGGSMALAVDDREDVWANAKNVPLVPKGEPPHNLLLVQPYHWGPFHNFADVNNTSGKDFDDRAAKDYSDHDSEDEQLLATGGILRRVHQRFYDNLNTTNDSPELSVVEVVRDLRREVLMGSKIVFSRIIPLHEQQEGANSKGARNEFLRHAENLGAKVVPDVVPDLTHAVGREDGTDKIRAARKVPGCFVVRVLWLMECVYSFARKDATPHIIGEPPRKIEGGSKPLGNSTKENSSCSSSDDDDDDDFAAELEKEMMMG